MALERMAEEKFAQIMGRVLSPSRAIESPELLKGRDDRFVRSEELGTKADDRFLFMDTGAWGRPR
jgi:hypothetical protein